MRGKNSVFRHTLQMVINQIVPASEMEEEIGPGEFESRLLALAKAGRKAKALMWFSMAVFVLWFFAFSIALSMQLTPWLACTIVLPFFTVFVFVVKWLQVSTSIKRLVAGSMVRDALSEAFELTSYEPECHIDRAQIEPTRLIEKWDDIFGSDLVRGTYKGVAFAFSDIILLETTEDSDGDTQHKTKFSGQWLVCTLQKEIPEPLRLREGRRKSDMETENAAFNKKFQILTRDPHTAFYVLTPHFMDYILAMDRQADARTYLCFSGRQAHVAFHNKKRNLFEVNTRKLRNENDIALLRGQIKQEAKYMTDIIDELLRNQYLFGTEEK